ncbi:alkaline phosphatase D family protein [Myroides sp. M-43]|uniref:alkaline phosphatase D family protein n=1 Tax=Myroides oncorhynchi TaxID=2893756 RepID=UPI001E551127|nr:alkaline phosphatase D family protein [Myroides oncorhynchi]MCC9042285.1 alkaline phosphatase D family protein [Myroides oncorhynchi]
MKQPQLNRRNFLRSSLLASGSIFLAPIIVSCSNDDNNTSTEEQEGDLTIRNFDYGVASFDPTSTSVIIWTRYAKADLEVNWQMARDISFKDVVRQGVALISSSTDHTLAIEVQGLPSNSKFYYRFYNKSTKDTSVIGETITLPAYTDNVSNVKLAVASCSNYPAGLFNIYADMAKSDVDVIIHLGDYIYEYAPGQYGTNVNTASLNRAHKPNKEIVSLEDYRERYKQYRSDVNLQLAHQKKPFICVWDDHEIANDTYKDGAENHQPDTEGSFEVRKRAALQAYSEFIPLKTGKDTRIYRSFEFGNILSLHMLDTRVIARDKQLNYDDYFSSEGFDQNKFMQAYMNPSRQLMGQEQLGWLVGQMSNSKATWQVLGQQVLMAKMLVPTEFLMLVNQIMAEIEKAGSASASSLDALQKTLGELVVLKTRMLKGDPTLTAVEKARITTVLPYNLDAWDGYAVEREKLYSLCKGKKVMTLAGDTHNAWYSQMKTQSGEVVGYELATSSISSPGMETYLGLSNDMSQARQLEQVMPMLIDELEYVNLSDRGYLYVDYTSVGAKAEWRFVDTIYSSSYTMQTKKSILI